MASTALALVLCLTSGVEPAAAVGGAHDPLAALNEALRQAEDALTQHEVQIAESRYRTALLEGWLLLGSLEQEEGRPEKAAAAFERAAASAVEVRRPHLSLALVELQLGGAERAVSLLRGLKRQNLADATIRRILPRALMAADQVDEAIQEMKEVHILAPRDLENTYALARAYLGQKRLEAAAPLFAELAEGRPIPQTRVLIGRTYRDFGFHEQAREELEAALAQDPKVPRARYYLGTVDLRDQGQDLLEEAARHFEAELEVVPDDPMTSFYLGLVLMEQRRHQEAVPRFELASRHLTARPDALQFLGRSYLALGRLDEAVAALRRALEIATATAEQIATMEPVDSRRRQLSSLHFQLAQALRRRGDGEAAAPHFAAAKELSARSAEGAREVLEAYLEDDGDQRLAITTWPLELAPFSGFSPQERAGVGQAVEKSLVQTYFNLAVLQLRSERHARAAELFEHAAELDPGFPQLQYSLGVALFNSGQFEKAAPPLSRAFGEAPEDQTASSVSLRENLRRMLALAWYNSGGYEKAAELLADDPERAANPSLEYTYAVALVRSGRAAEAEPVFAGLLAGNADWPELNVLLGQAHAQQDDYDAAVRYLERALELKGDVAEAQRTLGDIYLRQGKLDEAEAALAAELRAHPQDAQATYTLAVVLDLNRKSEEALELLRPLLEARPDLADGRYLLGKILLAQGAAEEARAQLEAAAELSPGDANIRYQLGQAYQRLGQREKARRQFEEYSRLKKDSRLEKDSREEEGP